MKSKVTYIASRIDRQALLFGVATWVLSFGYQLAFYSYYLYSASPLLADRNVFSYYSGVIGDGLILPTLNVLVFLLLKDIGARLSLKKFMIFLGLGVSVTVAIHLIQGTLALTNWAMPFPFQWSGIGRFHFFYMWWEFSFLFFAMSEIIRNWRSVTTNAWHFSLFGLSWLGVGAFIASFIVDYTSILGWKF